MIKKKIAHALDVIEKAIDKYPNIAVASSFGKDSIVALHLCQRIKHDIQVFSVMTPFKFASTRHYKNHIENRWRLNCATFEALPSDINPHTSGIEKCCDYYKVDQTKRAIKELNLDAWICGLRGTEGHTRKFLNEIEEKDGLVKINPILAFTEAEVWLYHAMYSIGVHPLYKEGYRSLGCEPCSKPDTDTERGGRWEGTEKCGAECGIHTKNLK